MHETSFLLNIAVALVAAFVGGTLAKLAKLPVLIGYLLAGIVVGPHTPGPVAQPEVVNPVANLGVALLMFAVGAHFSLDKLQSVRRTALLGGGLQIVGTIAMGTLLGLALGWSLYGGLYLGCTLSLSSTAVMMKLLEERGEQESEHGAAMLGMLVTQDLCVVLMAPLLPALSQATHRGPAALASIGWALLVGAILLSAILFLAMRGVPTIMKRIALLGSPELLLLAGMAICLAAAIGAEKAGLGLALGAFLAGLVISETDYAHHLLGQIRPIRDLFASLFFVSIGMMLDPTFVFRHLAAIAAVVVSVVIGKALIGALAVYASGQRGGTPIRTGLGLAQIGEFSFVLATLGYNEGLISGEISGVILSGALITLVLAPFVYQSSDAVSRVLSRPNSH